MTRALAVAGLLVAWGALLTAGCASGLGIGSQRPTVAIVGSDLGTVDAAGATAKLVLRIENPNPLAIELVMISWRASLAGKLVGEGGSEQKLRLESQSRGELTVPVRVSWKRETVAGRASVPYHIHLELSFTQPAGVLAIPVDAHGTFPVPTVQTP